MATRPTRAFSGRFRGSRGPCVRVRPAARWRTPPRRPSKSVYRDRDDNPTDALLTVVDQRSRWFATQTFGSGALPDPFRQLPVRSLSRRSSARETVAVDALTPRPMIQARTASSVGYGHCTTSRIQPLLGRLPITEPQLCGLLIGPLLYATRVTRGPRSQPYSYTA